MLMPERIKYQNQLTGHGWQWVQLAQLAALQTIKTFLVKELPSEVFKHPSTPKPDAASGHDFR